MSIQGLAGPAVIDGRDHHPSTQGAWHRPRTTSVNGEGPVPPPAAGVKTSFSQVATVSFQGMVVAFARVDAPPTGAGRTPLTIKTDIQYNVLSLDVDSASDDLDWDGWRRLELPNQVRPSGMQLINVPAVYDRRDRLAALDDAQAPFRVITNQEYVYLLRQAAGGTLLVNRFRLVRQVSPDNPQEVEYVLNPAWEVRFQRSGKPDLPLDDKDVQAYESPDREPFVEPTLELPIPGISEGRFDAALLPHADAGSLMCTIAVLGRVPDRIDIHELPLDGDGRFLLGDKPLDRHGLAPDVTFTLQTPGPDHRPLALSGRPALAYFLKQERSSVAPSGATDGSGGDAGRPGGDGSILVKRAGRLLLAVCAQPPDEAVTLATVELGIGTDGTIARPTSPLTAAPTGVAPYALELGEGSSVVLPDLSLTQGFGFELWLQPRSDASPQLVVGNPDDPTAPRLSLIAEGRLELAVTDVDGSTLRATTGPRAVPREAWSHVFVDFDPDPDPDPKSGSEAGARVTIQVNGEVLVDEAVAAGAPNGHPVTSLGAASDGFVGTVDSLAVDHAGQQVAAWPLDTVSYTDAHGAPLDPPQTPNRHDPARPGLVFGAHLVPSTNPAATGEGGALTVDPRGLTIVTSYFEDLATYGEMRSSPALLAGADGLIHCYFRGRDDRFCVMQQAVEVARATFRATWSTAAGDPQTGPIELVATQAGTFMNGAEIVVRDPEDEAGLPAAFCDLTITSPSGRTETWRGLPRSLEPFAASLGGEAIHDPSDRRLLSGAATYYDASGTRSAGYVALPDTSNAALVGFVSRYARVALESVQVTAASDGRLDLAFTHSVKGWSQPLQHTWRGVPARVHELLRVLDGTSTDFTYTTTSQASGSTPSYSIPAGSGGTTADTVIFFTGPTVKNLAQVTVSSGADANLCTVYVRLVEHSPHDMLDPLHTRSATWTGVPRRQDLVAATIDGSNDGYDYDTRASGDWKAIGKALTVVTSGNAALVGNVDRLQMKEDSDLRAYASLFEALVTAPVNAKATLPPVGTVAASRFQGASAVVDGAPPVPISQGSDLFRAALVDQPDQGAVGLVDNTAGLTDGTAALVRPGINAGWRNQPDQRTVTLHGGYVDFATDEATAPNIGALTIQGDLSLELWCRPPRSGGDADRPDQRLVTFARTPSPTEGGVPVRYLAGLRDCPSLRATRDTTVYAGHGTSTGTISLWCSPLAAGGAVAPGTIASLSTLGIVTPIVSVAVDGDRRIRAEFLPDATAPPIVAPGEVAAGEWYQVALPWSVETSRPGGGSYQYDVTVDLYVNGTRIGGRTWRTTRPSGQRFQLATMVIGEIDPTERTTLPMLVNEAAFFARPLGRAEIGQSSEQRIADNAPDLVAKWMFLEGTGNRARNSAATGQAYDVTVKPHADWDPSGLYVRPTLGHGDNVAVLADAPVIRGWSHLALVHQAGYALDVQGDDYVDCGRGATTELGDDFTLEAWVEPAAAEGSVQPMTILAKGDDYQLGLTADGHPYGAVQVRIGEETRTFELEGDRRLSTGAVHYIVLTYEMVTVDVKVEDAAEPRYEAHLALWVDGEAVASGMRDDEGRYVQYVDVVERVSSNAEVNLARTSRLGGSRYLHGYLSDTRMWTRVLSAVEIADALASRRAPANRADLVSWWRFAEAGGRTAFDVQGNNDGRLSRGDLRILYQPTSTNQFFVNGRPAEPTWLDGAAAVGGYPTGDQFRFGRSGPDGETGSGSDDARGPAGFRGQLDSVRIWSTQLTGEQIADSMQRALSGTEPHLAGLWTFDRGSGPVVEDATGRGNTGHLAGDPLPVWSVSTAPLGDEAEGVLNILGGIPTYVHDVVTETPAVIEYADLQRDAYGGVLSVMKRAYISIDDGAMHLVTGYKAGDLETVYLGQAQSMPTVIGFIEGAPPIPSENQTTPYWKTGGALINNYAAAASITFEEADKVSYAFSAGREGSQSLNFKLKAGMYMKVEYDLELGIGKAWGKTLATFEGNGGEQVGLAVLGKDTEGANRTTQSAVTMTTGLKPGGAWEPGTTPREWVNPTVGRRYLPANTGMALVKSRTVDLYASILATTRSMVKLTYAPNPDIPEDVNILTFPIDPGYIKNGTLDGKVGLENDPDYPNANQARGSYFRPVEAYALKRRIERDQARLAAYYQQFDVERHASQLRSGRSWDAYRQAQRANAAYDWATHLAKRNIVNTYVWTAAGGTHAEQTSTMNVYTESYGALTSRGASLGAYGAAKGSFVWAGPSVEFDFLYGTVTEASAVRSKEESAAFGLHALAQPDQFLHAPVLGEGKEYTFGPEAAEGKVDGYRYLAFFLAPTLDNFDDFSRLVVDRQWLAESMDAGAVALREATVAGTGAWRICYRVTYVSRVPPKFQPVPDETRAPDIEAPANPEDNALLVSLVEKAIGKPDPTPVEIGRAIREVIGRPVEPDSGDGSDGPGGGDGSGGGDGPGGGEGPGATGPLAEVLPWWPQFLTDAENPLLPAAGVLRSLRQDLLRYMVSTYAAREATRSPS